MTEVLISRFGQLEPAGSGAWSTAFRFERDGRELVVRVGPHVSDFRVDAEMAEYRSPSLAIPETFELEALPAPHGDLWICVSTFAPGTPLEAAAAEEWRALVPRVADLFDAMHAISPPARARVPAWPEVLSTRDEGDGRLDGWRDRLAAERPLADAFAVATARLEALTALDHVARVEPTLLHCDLINRNVHVSAGEITGVFDWGCRRWGDHLYDLAWFEFWSPWYPDLDVGLLRNELTRRWGSDPDPDRLTACLVHIGADHLVYNVVIDDPAGGEDVRQRMADLDLL